MFPWLSGICVIFCQWYSCTRLCNCAKKDRILVGFPSNSFGSAALALLNNFTAEAKEKSRTWFDLIAGPLAKTGAAGGTTGCWTGGLFTGACPGGGF